MTEPFSLQIIMQRRQEQCGSPSRETDFSKDISPTQDERMAEYGETTLEPLDHLSDVDWEDLLSSVELDMDLLSEYKGDV